MMFRRGDVVLISFIFSEGTQTKKRPALVLSGEKYHQGRQEIILAAITSNTDRILPGDTKIEKWKDAGLKFPSLVAGIVQTMKTSMIEKKLGSLTEADFHHVQHNVRQAMGF